MNATILNSKRKIFYSQSGEDGFLDYILSKIPNKNNWVVEFGAWDGIYLSNSFYLLKTRGFQGVLIEADQKKFEDLKKNMAPYPAICINQFVGYGANDNLDNILSSTPIPKDFDLLSIDIDGNDYHVWEALRKYSPKVVIIEINIKDRPDIERINTPGSPFILGISGSSILSLTLLARSKQYALLAQIGCNAVYVKKELLQLFSKMEPSPQSVFTYEEFKLNDLTPLEVLQKIKILWLYKLTSKIGSFLSWLRSSKSLPNPANARSRE